MPCFSPGATTRVKWRAKRGKKRFFGSTDQLFLPLWPFNNERSHHLFTFVYFPTWVIIVYNLWSTNNIEKDTVKSTDIWKYLQYLKWTHLQQYFAADAKSRCAWQQSKGKTINWNIFRKRGKLFFTNHTEMAFAEEEEKNKNWFQPKAEPEKINWYSPTGRLDFHWWWPGGKMPNIWEMFCFYCDWNTVGVGSLLNQVVLEVEEPFGVR